MYIFFVRIYFIFFLKKVYMQKIIEFELDYLPPSVNAIYLRSKHGGVFISQRARDFKQRIENAVKHLMDKPVEGELRIEAEFSLRRKGKRDLDNMLKVLCDAMNNIVYKDDNQIMEISCKKEYTTINKTKIVVYFI